MDYYVDIEELERFYINNISNTNFGLIVQEIEGLFDAFESDIEFIEVPGRNGELIVDNMRVKSKDLVIKGYVDATITQSKLHELRGGINKWLKGSVTYKNIDFIKESIRLNALCYKFTMKEVMEDLAEIEIHFRVQGEGINESI